MGYVARFSYLPRTKGEFTTDPRWVFSGGLGVASGLSEPDGLRSKIENRPA